MKTVAVILPTYNSGHFLELQINSILCQTGVDVHLYIMDDRSTDGTNFEIAKYSKRFPNVYVIDGCQKFGNASKSFFFLLTKLKDSLLKYEFVALSDHDDVWMPFKLIRGINLLEDKGVSGYSSDFFSADYSPLGGLTKPSADNKTIIKTKYDHFFEGPGPGCTFILSKALYASLVKFLEFSVHADELDKVFWHDWFIYLYAVENNHEWIIDGSSHMVYVQHGTNETGVNRGIKALRKRLRLLASNWFLDQAKLMANIISPNSTICTRLNRMSLLDRLFFLVNFYSLRRRLLHSCIITFFLVFSNKLNLFKLN